MIEPVHHHLVVEHMGKFHVSKSFLAAARYIKTKFSPSEWRKMPKFKRRYAIAAAIQHHAKNRHEYRYVMGTVPRKYPEFKPRYFFNKDTSHVSIASIEEMRKYKA